MGSVRMVETTFSKTKFGNEAYLCARHGSSPMKCEVDCFEWVECSLLTAWRLMSGKRMRVSSKQNTVTNACMSCTLPCKGMRCLLHNLFGRQNHKDLGVELMLRDIGKRKTGSDSPHCACGRLEIKHRKPASWGTELTNVIVTNINVEMVA